MPYFLDGNNLIGLARGSARPSEEDRSALVAEVADRLRRTKARVVLFFDGGGRSAAFGALSVRSAEGSADDAIVAEIARARAPGEIIVVTADRELSARARNVGAKTLSPPEFWSRVGTSTGSGEREEKRPVDVEEWMRYFEEGKKEKE
jgi:rRNA-processing protein FCF1